MFVRRVFRTYLTVEEDCRDPECLSTSFKLLRSVSREEGDRGLWAWLGWGQGWWGVPVNKLQAAEIGEQGRGEQGAVGMAGMGWVQGCGWGWWGVVLQREMETLGLGGWHSKKSGIEGYN